MPKLLMLILCVTLAVLSGCTGVSPTDTPADAEIGPLIIIGGIELGMDEISYLMSSAVDEYALMRNLEYGMIDWNGQIGGQPARQFFLRRVVELAVNAYIIEKKAAELGVELTDEEEESIDFEIAMEIDILGGREAFLNSIGIEEVYRYYGYVIPYLSEKLLWELFGDGGVYELDDAALLRYFQNNYTTAIYIFLSGTGSYGDVMDEGELAMQRSVADALWRIAAGGADFYEMVREHDQSYYMMIYPEGMPVPRGMLGDAFDDALSALEVGGLSGVVVTEDGFYIIKRLPQDLEWFENHIGDIWYYGAHDALADKTEEWGEGLDVIIKDAFWAVDPLSLIAVG
jgi:hypothetical protein